MTDELARAILAELVRIRELLEGRQRLRHVEIDVPTERVMRALASAAIDSAFTSVHVMQHVNVDPALREALEAAGLAGPRKLGKFLRRIAGVPIAGYLIQRVGTSSEGIIWTCVSVDQQTPKVRHCIA
jgi:hypothetical protein